MVLFFFVYAYAIAFIFLKNAFLKQSFVSLQLQTRKEYILNKIYIRTLVMLR